LTDEYREPLIRAALLNFGEACDVICLQEVDRFEEFYAPILAEMNFGYCYGLRGMTPAGSFIKIKREDEVAAKKRDRVVVAFNLDKLEMYRELKVRGSEERSDDRLLLLHNN
jgi:mRNA deadenylase 3'-5' endonuclease subunit Ccr4